MKKIAIALILLSLVFAFCACNKTEKPNTDNTVSASADESSAAEVESGTLSAETDKLFAETQTIPVESLKISDLKGRWYGPNNNPVIDIHEDGSGSVKIDGEAYDAEFSVENGVFSISSEVYEISGAFSFTGSLISVEINCGGKDYTVVFNSASAIEHQRSYFYEVGDKKYEYNPEKGTISETSFPFDKNAKSKSVYTVLDTAPAELNLENYLVYIFYEMPPENYGKPDSNIKSIKDNGIPVPEKLDNSTAASKLTVNGEEVTAQVAFNSVIGDWTTKASEKYTYFFGNLSEDKNIKYCFNEDGTGSVFVDDTNLGYLNYTYENGIIDLTVVVNDKTQTNKGYAIRIGDILYIENVDGEALSMAWINLNEISETTATTTTEEQ